MKALTLTAYNQFEFSDAPEPEISENEVLISVKACGICGSDIHGMDGSSGRRIPPIIMGHEAAGEISQIGSAVRKWKVGDRVTFDSTVCCGKCPSCLAGQVNLCPNRNVLGVSCSDYRRNGAFAEFVKVKHVTILRRNLGCAPKKNERKQNQHINTSRCLRKVFSCKS